MTRQRILIIEAERVLAEMLEHNFQNEGFDAVRASNGEDALRAARAAPPHVVIIDTPRRAEICQGLRRLEQTRDVPILLISETAEEADQLAGFATGADDFVTKPFSVKVLVQRVKALKRRKENHAVLHATLEHLGVRIDPVQHQAWSNGTLMELTPTEFRLLETLLREPGRAFTRAHLLECAVRDGTIVLERTIDVHIKALRQKLGPARKLIETVREVGYRFCEKR